MVYQIVQIMKKQLTLLSRCGGDNLAKKINYEKEMKSICIRSIEANQIFMNNLAKETEQKIEYKIGNKWVVFKSISMRDAVLSDSLFLRYMKSSLIKDGCDDFIIVKFNYDAQYRINGVEYQVDKHDLRTQYYKDGVTYMVEKKDRKGNVVSSSDIHFKMLMRSSGKAKKSECVFIRDNLHHKAINYLTMNLHSLIERQSQNDPSKTYNLVALSAYQTMVTASAAEGYIKIPLENILILKDEEVYTDGMNAAIVKNEEEEYTRNTEYILDFESPELERLINKKGYTFDPDKSNEFTLIPDKSKEALKEYGIRNNGKYPGKWGTEKVKVQKCKVHRTDSAHIKNVIWDGMGIIDESIFPKDKNGFIYCRSHFFKSCLFRGNIQEFFEDYCKEKQLDFDTLTVEKVDMFERKIKLSDVKVVITDKSIKWFKFIDLMGGTEKKAYNYYRRFMKEFDDYYAIVKTAHPSKWGDLQLMAYQMNNSLPTTDETILKNITQCAIKYCNDLKNSDEAYLKHLEMTKNYFNINEIWLELVKWNSDFKKTALFRDKKSRDISGLKEDFCLGRMPQVGDNLTIADNPISLLLKAVGDENPLKEECFEIMSDGVQCYTSRFKNEERLAAFRSPHNSPNNIIHLYNVYPEKLVKYFPNLGNNVIVLNAIKTDTQARLSGQDCDSDFVYTTNQPDIVDLARKAYIEYPTIINEVSEQSENIYHFSPEEYARLDNQIADAQVSIGTSTDTAQLALSYYYDSGMTDKELEDCFIILSVIGQISIDLAKKDFDINVVNEIKRIKNLPCMRNRNIPVFFAKNKEMRGNNKYKQTNADNTDNKKDNPDNKKIVIRAMNCPMDIMAKMIKAEVKKYSDRESHLPLRNFFNHDIVNTNIIRYAANEIIKAAEDYNKYVKNLESKKADYKTSAYCNLQILAMNSFLQKADKKLNQETVMKLVIDAFYGNHTEISNAIIRFLFIKHKDLFMNCFRKNGQNSLDIFLKMS